jgi:3D (Asp-Asp-Asp) domain-containing protein
LLGEALAGAGMPVIGLDVSEPGSDGPLPRDGNIRIKRVSESLVLAEESTPFDSTYQDSAQFGLGQEQIAQPGVKGLKVTRTRVRYEDGNEVSRQAESETVVRPAQERVVVRGTKIVENTKTVNGVTIEYWREMQMYATVYSPCESATGSAGECSYGTASGLRAGKGVVAVDPSLYAYLNGQRLYIPGYGFAVIGDLGGGYLLEPAVSRYKWIDLGFDDNNMPDMTGWITVYFLAPAPASIPDALK